jgi:hypothetical protein
VRAGLRPGVGKTPAKPMPHFVTHSVTYAETTFHNSNGPPASTREFFRSNHLLVRRC